MQSMIQSVENFAKNSLRTVTKFLDKNPAIYKVVLIACHFFRACGMYGFMMVSPFSLPATCILGVGGSLLYRASVERYCCYRFAIPSCLGAGAYWISKASIIQIMTKAAFKSLEKLAWNAVCALPFIGYVGYVIYLSHTEFEQKGRGIGSHCVSCY